MDKQNGNNEDALTLEQQTCQEQPIAADALGTKPEKKQKKKKTPLRKAIIGIAITLGALILVAGFLVLRLFSRMAKPGTSTFENESGAVEAYVPMATATPTLTPSPTAENTPLVPTPTPLPTPEPGPLPLEELYQQTYLTGEQLQAIAEDNVSTDVINVLLVGVDRRGTRGGYSNTDTMMVATIDKKNNRLKLTSIMRDLYVHIEGGKPAKLNSAAGKGGIPLLIKTINDALRLNIQNYVLVDFSMFEKVVNKLGGVTVYMTSQEISAANDNIAGLNRERGVSYLWDGFIFANGGNVGLTGKQALAYARIRKIDSDFYRTNRQFKVLTAIFAKFRAKNLVQQYALLDEIMPLVETDLSGFEIIDMAISALSMDTAGLLHYTVPVDGLYKSATQGGSYVLLFDMPATALMVHDFIYNSTQAPEDAKVLSAGKSLPPRTPSPTLDPALDPANPDGPVFIPPDAQGDPEIPEIPYIPEIPQG